MSKDDNTSNNASIEKLFGSKTRAKLLNLFFEDVTKSYYVREITRAVDEQINSVRRELINLESVGVVKNESFDGKVYYSANMKSPYAHAFQEIFAPQKAAGTGVIEVKRVLRRNNDWDEVIRPVVKYLKGLIVVERMLGQEGIDMLIIGDDKGKRLTRWAEVVERRQGRPMNYMIMDENDFLYRKSVRDKFLGELMEMEIVELYDPERIVQG